MATNPQTNEKIVGAFVRDSQGMNSFVGKCWPNSSVWIDYLNENA